MVTPLDSKIVAKLAHLDHEKNIASASVKSHVISSPHPHVPSPHPDKHIYPTTTVHHSFKHNTPLRLASTSDSNLPKAAFFSRSSHIDEATSLHRLSTQTRDQSSRTPPLGSLSHLPSGDLSTLGSLQQPHFVSSSSFEAILKPPMSANASFKNTSSYLSSFAVVPPIKGQSGAASSPHTSSSHLLQKIFDSPTKTDSNKALPASAHSLSTKNVAVIKLADSVRDVTSETESNLPGNLSTKHPVIAQGMSAKTSTASILSPRRRSTSVSSTAMTSSHASKEVASAALRNSGSSKQMKSSAESQSHRKSRELLNLALEVGESKGELPVLERRLRIRRAPRD